jgi:hypothetical protein
VNWRWQMTVFELDGLEIACATEDDMVVRAFLPEVRNWTTPTPTVIPATLERKASSPNVALSPEGPDPGAVQVLANGDWETGDYTGWQDRSIDPASFVTQVHPRAGSWHLRQGGNQGYMTSTYQAVALSQCDLSRPVWLHRCLATVTEEPEPDEWSATAAALFYMNWTQAAWLWQFYESDAQGPDYRCDWYRGEGLNADVYLWVASETSARPWATWYDHDDYAMWCLPLGGVPMERVYLPLVAAP